MWNTARSVDRAGFALIKDLPSFFSGASAG
jgi:hypothetical protein